MATASKSEMPSSVADDPPRSWFAVLGVEGYIVAVDPMWRFSDEPNAPFGSRFTVGASYVDLCASWPQREGAELADAVRTVLGGSLGEQRVEYEYPSGSGHRRAEMRVSRFELAGNDHFLVLHTDLIAEERKLLHRFREAKSLVQEQVIELTNQTTELTEARQRAIETMRVKAEFMANLSHEIRTPMNGIIGMTDLCLETELSDEQRDYLSSAQSSAHSLLSLLNNILDYSNFESNRVELNNLPFGLLDVLAQVVGPLALRAHDKTLQLSHELDPEIPDLLIGDPERLGQLLRNLIDNAIKFTERGEVTVRGMLENVNEQTAEVRFEILDTGVGIDPSLHERIFEPFVQADGSTTRTHGGTGLGLTISSQLAAQMGGHLRVESQPGMGSTFSFAISFARVDPSESRAILEAADGAPALVLPTSPAAPTVNVTSPPAEVQATNGGLRILVAEDNPVAQKMARSLLERHGNAVEIVKNGKDAVHRATSESWDLLLMDIDMPVLDGFGATALIRESEKAGGGHLPILALTGRSMVPDVERFRRAGMDDVLSKPLEAYKLATVLDRVWHRLGKNPGSGGSEEEAKIPPAIDTVRLLEYVGGDRGLIDELVEMFGDERATILEPVVRAIERNSPTDLELAAHRLKGTFGALAADPAAEQASLLVSFALAGDLNSARTVLNELRRQLGRMESELVAFAGSHQEPIDESSDRRG